MSRRDGEIPNTHEERAPSAATVERWPCGCPKGMTPHGVGWKDCIFSDEQKEKWAREASSAAGSRDESLAGETTQRSKSLHTGMKYPCLYPLPDGQRCLECITCQEVAMGGNVSLNVLAKNEKAARELLLELSEDPRVVTAHIALGAGKYLIPVRGE